MRPTSLAHANNVIKNYKALEEFNKRLVFVPISYTNAVYVGDKEYEIYGFLHEYIYDAILETIKDYDYEKFIVENKKAINSKLSFLKRKRFYITEVDLSDLIVYPFYKAKKFVYKDITIPYLGHLAHTEDAIVWNIENENFYKEIYLVISRNMKINKFFDKILYNTERLARNDVLFYDVDFYDRKKIYHFIYKSIFTLCIKMEKHAFVNSFKAVVPDFTPLDSIDLRKVFYSPSCNKVHTLHNYYIKNEQKFMEKLINSIKKMQDT